jgi:hypothetical protein
MGGSFNSRQDLARILEAAECYGFTATTFPFSQTYKATFSTTNKVSLSASLKLDSTRIPRISERNSTHASQATPDYPPTQLLGPSAAQRSISGLAEAQAAISCGRLC